MSDSPGHCTHLTDDQSVRHQLEVADNGLVVCADVFIAVAQFPNHWFVKIVSISPTYEYEVSRDSKYYGRLQEGAYTTVEVPRCNHVCFGPCSISTTSSIMVRLAACHLSLQTSASGYDWLTIPHRPRPCVGRW